MVSAARALDRIDLDRAHTAEDAAAFEARFAGVRAAALIGELVTGELNGHVALVSSFGAESAVLLHMVAAADPATPILFVDTLKMFRETLGWRDAMVERLGLSNLRVHRPDARLLAERDAAGERWSYDPDGCCDIRKVEPLARALAGFEAWISGRKGFQAATRTALPRFEVDEGRLKINPLADWSAADLDAYLDAHDLPRHPLVAQGYASIGCAPCTSKVRPGEDPRAGRWRGWDKVECGIHRPNESGRDPAF